jgi:membrane associated rhomboid family serine protease
MAGLKGIFMSEQPPEPQLKSQPEPVFFLAPVVTVLIALCAGFYLLQTYVLGYAANVTLSMQLAFIPARYSAGGMPLNFGFLVSPFGYSLLHAGFAHLAVNMVWLAAFGSPLAARIGTWRFLLFWAATAIGAALMHFLVYPYSAIPLVGASGAISGMTGAAARFSFRTSDGRGVRSFTGAPLPVAAALTNRTVMTFIGVWMAANLITGMGWTPGDVNASNIAWEAHIGGFLIGFFCMTIFDRPISGGP